MDQQWYYGVGIIKHGPFSALELQRLASAGTILGTDTVWKAGVEQGATACRVKHLFSEPGQRPPIPTVAIEQQAVPETISSPPQGVQAQPGNLGVDVESAASNAEKQTASAYQPTQNNQQVRKSRAQALRGAKIVGQDGTTVQFKKICTTCGHEDATRSTMKIRSGMTRTLFYCPKCRKSRAVEIQGIG